MERAIRAGRAGADEPAPGQRLALVVGDGAGEDGIPVRHLRLRVVLGSNDQLEALVGGFRVEFAMLVLVHGDPSDVLRRVARRLYPDDVGVLRRGERAGLRQSTDIDVEFGVAVPAFFDVDYALRAGSQGSGHQVDLSTASEGPDQGQGENRGQSTEQATGTSAKDSVTRNSEGSGKVHYGWSPCCAGVIFAASRVSSRGRHVSVQHRTKLTKRRKVGQREIELEFDGDAVPLSAVWERLAQSNPGFSQFLSDGYKVLDSSYSLLVNGRLTSFSQSLGLAVKDGDRVAIMLPLAGG